MTANRRPKSPQRPMPAPWKLLLEQKGISSVRALSQRTSLDHVTVNDIVYGDRQASERSIQEIAGVLNMDLPTAYRLMGHTAKYVEPWTPPACSARLEQEQRKVVEDLIYVLVEGSHHQHHQGDQPRTEPQPKLSAQHERPTRRQDVEDDEQGHPD